MNSEFYRQTEVNLSIDVQTFKTCNEAVMAVKTYKHSQSTQTMEIYLVPPTEVSLFDSQYLNS